MHHDRIAVDLYLSKTSQQVFFIEHSFLRGFDRHSSTFPHSFSSPHASPRTCELRGRSRAVSPADSSPLKSCPPGHSHPHHGITIRFHFPRPIPCWPEY